MDINELPNSVEGEKVSTISQEGEAIYKSFEDMDLDPEILRGVFEIGFERPSAIQQRGIVPIKNGRDCIIQAQSGTGKTATFSIGALSRIDLNLNETQALILGNTRELAIQIQSVVATIAKNTSVVCKACIGGTQISKDIEEFRAKPHIVIGTPGRVLDMITKRHVLDASKLKLFILDEADEMLSRGFKDQIYDIFQVTNQDIQVVLVSATMPPDVHEVTKKFMRDPVEILVKNEELTLEGIRQYQVKVGEERWKFDTLTDIYGALQVSQSVIFCNSRVRVEDLTKRLRERGFTVSAIHGELPQTERTEILKHFRDGINRILISTDLLSRGIDVQQISLVINYDMPSSVEAYLHRIGRGGRFGRKGTAVNFVTKEEEPHLTEISQHYHTHIPDAPKNLAEILN